MTKKNTTKFRLEKYERGHSTFEIDRNIFDELVVVDDELVDAPVLVAAVRQVTTDDDRDLALLQLLHGDL